jgi:EAL domain-containing protein (putative c-di-GMP-specific phosphodiesterase class I)/ActR/RegA family two-component response regulator
MQSSDKILVIDDDPFAVRMIQLQLIKLGFNTVCGFTDPCEGLRFLREQLNAVQLIVCDLQMPGLDGIEFVREIAKEKYAGKVLLVSGEDARVLRSAHRLVGALGMTVLGAMQKPINLDVLRTLLCHSSDAVTPAPGQRDLSAGEIAKGLAQGEFENFYQPKVSVETGAVMGWEALIRWRHPRYGVLAPPRFLPAMQAANLNGDLLKQVLTAPGGALPLLREFGIQSERDFKIAINLSDSNLLDPLLPDKLAKLMGDYDLHPSSLLLEISEDRPTEDRTISNTTLSRLALKGFALSLDDFGAGETTMADLSDIAISELKFDRAFVQNIHLDPAQRRSLSSCIKMAEALGLNTVAEGVECEEEWRVIKELGCKTVQGYFVAKPMPVPMLAQWFKEWNQRVRQGDLFAPAKKGRAASAEEIVFS